VACDDKNPCTSDNCSALVGCVATPLAEKADCAVDGKSWCVAGKCVAKAYCGDGVINVSGEQCDDGNAKDGDGCSATCQFEVSTSCKALLQKLPATPDGVYPIDPDGAGPIAPANLFCDMKNGGLTLVANIYDSAGDDAPNSTDYVVSGWQQTGSGKWDAKASIVDRAWGGNTGSAAVSMAFVEALGKAAGQKNLKMCFVHKDGYDTTCRNSADGSLTLVSYATGNPKLTVYAADKLTYTFGRLAGLAGSVDGYDYESYLNDGYIIPRSPGLSHEFGWGAAFVEQNGIGFPAWHSVWQGTGYGMCYRPSETEDTELRTGAESAPNVALLNGGPVANPSPNTYGFRLYIGPSEKGSVCGDGTCGANESFQTCATDCPCAGGTAVMTAQFWCNDKGNAVEEPSKSVPASCVNGTVANQNGYYGKLPCPFDVSLSHSVGWAGPCSGCVNSIIVTNGGGSTTAVWKGDATAYYCCSGATLLKVTKP
jgi:cysteine-rich repeat protein